MLSNITRFQLSVVVGGFVTICASFFVKYYAFPKALEIYIQKNLYLYPGSEIWEPWKEVPFPVMTYIYIFNITNPEEIKNLGAKPKLQEVGGYAYHQMRKKHNVTLHSDATVSYLESRTYFSQPSLSKGSEDDLVTTVNVPLLAAVAMLQGAADWKPSAILVNMILKGMKQHLFVTKTVREILFEGYYNPLIAQAQFFMGSDTFHGGKFSLMGLNNGTKIGPFTVRTGEDDINNLGTITSYMGSPSVGAWDDKYCNMINGSDGTMFHPFLNRDERLYVFAKDACRSIFLEYDRDVDVSGIHAYRFIAPDKIFYTPSQRPENTCFFKKSSHEHISGLSDLSPCLGAPLFTTNPHFYHADEGLLRAVEGLHPTDEEHQSYMDLHPMMGLPLRGVKMLQFNALLRPYPALTELRHVPKVILPIMWVKEGADVPEEFLRTIRLRSNVPQTIVTALFVIGLILGVGMMLCGIILCKRSKSEMQENKQQIQSTTLPLLNRMSLQFVAPTKT